jgi:hypothetical protein
MCPACLSTVAVIAAGAGSTGGLAALVVRKVRRKPAKGTHTNDAPAGRPANEENIR